MLLYSVASLLALSTALAAAVPAQVSQLRSGCSNGISFTGQAGCSQCTKGGDIVCGRDEGRITNLKCTRFSTGLTWVPIDNPGTCGVDSPNLMTRGQSVSCPSGRAFGNKAGCSTCNKVGKIICGYDEDRVTDLKCTQLGPSLTWIPVDNPGTCGV